MEFTILGVPVVGLVPRYVSSYSDRSVSFIIFGITYDPSYDIFNNNAVITELEALSGILLYELLEIDEPIGTVYFVAHGKESTLLNMIQSKHVLGTRGAYFADTKNSEYDMPLYVIFAFDNPMGTVLVDSVKKNLQRAVQQGNRQLSELYRLLPVLK